MTADRWAEVERLLHDALQLTPEKRAAFLSDIGNADVRAEVSSLLAAECEPDGSIVDAARFEKVVAEEMDRVRQEVGEARFSQGKFNHARDLFVRLSLAPRFEEFLTLPAYELVTAKE